MKTFEVQLNSPEQTKGKAMTKDPICGMTVDEKTALRAERGGETFYFCSEHCRKKFLSQSAPAKTDGGCCGGAKAKPASDSGDCCGGKSEHADPGGHEHAQAAEEHSCCGGKASAGNIPAKGSTTVKVKAKVKGKKGKKVTVKFTIKGKGVSAKATAKVKVK